MSLYCSQRLNYQYPVCQGGKSTGSCRHAHPVRTTYRIASTNARRGCFSGRPAVFTSGSSGSIRAHCSSLVSEGYRLRRATRPELITRRVSHADTPILLKHALRGLGQLRGKAG